MNDFLDTTGALLYVFFCIVVFPLIALVNLLIWAVVVVRYLRTYTTRPAKTKTRRPVYQFPLGMDLAIERQ